MRKLSELKHWQRGREFLGVFIQNGRIIDTDSAGSMEKKKQEGYF